MAALSKSISMLNKAQQKAIAPTKSIISRKGFDSTYEEQASSHRQ